jgi:hypothetical protein
MAEAFPVKRNPGGIKRGSHRWVKSQRGHFRGADGAREPGAAIASGLIDDAF